MAVANVRASLMQEHVSGSGDESAHIRYRTFFRTQIRPNQGKQRAQVAKAKASNGARYLDFAFSAPAHSEVTRQHRPHPGP